MKVKGNEEAVADYISGRMVDIKKILDEIAEETGEVYICIPNDTAEVLVSVGQQLGAMLFQWHKVVADRFALANKHKEKEL